MKRTVATVLILALFIIAIPCVALVGGEEKSPKTQERQAEYADISDKSGEETVKVFLSQDESVAEMTGLEYLVGCVAAEMPANFHAEALKAQAVVSYTYVKKLKNDGNTAQGGADISDSSDTHQGYIDKEERQKRWGDNFEKYESKITAAVQEVYGYAVTYDSKVITAAYHAVSSGQTEDAQNVWGSEVPYLKSVTSDGDKLSPSYSEQASFTAEEFKAKLSSQQGVSFSQEPSQWIGADTVKSDAGTVLKITVGSKEMTGQQLRSALGLRSACFDVAYSDGSFVFTVYGYGHGVGMSQYGADYMARQGATWQEIIKHYYTGVEVVKT